MPPTPCPHPESSQETLFPARDYITDHQFSIQQCRLCGLCRTIPQPDSEDLKAYYPAGYYGNEARYPSFLERLLERLYRTRAREIEQVAGVRGRVLDIGCGRGSLLLQLQRRGWSVSGTELSETSARYAREVLNLDVHVGDVRNLHLAGPFDLIILWHVLEHMYDPAGLLDAVRDLLRPGGTLLVAVPNFGSPEARLGRARWFHLDVPRHLSHFREGTLHSMLRSSCLEPCASRYFTFEYDFFSFVQTFLNVLNVRHNLLYDILRTRGAKVLAGASRTARGESLLTLTLAPLLGAASLVWVPLAAKLGWGATMTIYARRDSESSTDGETHGVSHGQHAVNDHA